MDNESKFLRLSKEDSENLAKIMIGSDKSTTEVKSALSEEDRKGLAEVMLGQKNESSIKNRTEITEDGITKEAYNSLVEGIANNWAEIENIDEKLLKNDIEKTIALVEKISGEELENKIEELYQKITSKIEQIKARAA